MQSTYPDPSELSSWLQDATIIAKHSGSILKQFWGRLHHIEEKEFAGDLVTEADKASEKYIIHSLKERFPSYAILAEESGQLEFNSESDFLWVIDPLDGTTNYAHQYPLFAVSIALLFKGLSILGVIYNPILEELFQAAQGQGATLNGRPIKVSDTEKLSRSLLATGFPYNRRQTSNNNYKEFCHFTHLTQGVRRGGSAALDLAYTAAGRFDGYWELGIKPWDMAAGIVILKEAGGQISDYNLDPINLSQGRILASNGKIHHSMSQELLSLHVL